MKSELEGATYPDEGSIERALSGVNRRFDGMEATMKLGFRKLEERLREQRECHRENSEDGQRAAQHWRLDLAVQLLTEVAMKIYRDGGGRSGNSDRVATVTDGGGSESEDGSGVGVGHDIKSQKPQLVQVMYNE